jgi:hypothetical protein
MGIAALKKRLGRRACLIQVGGMPPPDDLAASWFGTVHLGAAGEVWPTHGGSPMIPLGQLNLREAPYVPPVLADVAMLTVFFANTALEGGSQNGDGWLVRTYASLDGLEPMAMPDEARAALSEICGTTTPLKPFPIRYSVLDADYPDWPDVAGDPDIPEEIEEEWEEHFGAHPGLKLGGWPSLRQAELMWDDVEFAFQLGAEPRSGFALYGDGMCYFGRGTRNRRDVWAFEYQLL